MTAAGLRGAGDATVGCGGLSSSTSIYGLPITTLIFRNFFVGLPLSSPNWRRSTAPGTLRTFFDVALPLARPAFAVALIWQFTAVWNDFLLGRGHDHPRLLADHDRAEQHRRRPGRPVQPGHGQRPAGLPPMLVIYIVLSRYFMRGILASALKD